MCNDNIRNYNSRNSRIRWFGLSYTYTELVNYISHKNYPVDFSKKQKRRLREKAQSFYVSNQSLFHKGVKGKKQRVVKAADVKNVVEEMHTSVVGGCHFGINTTQQKIAERYWWRTMSEDIRHYVRTCDR